MAVPLLSRHKLCALHSAATCRVQLLESEYARVKLLLQKSKRHYGFYVFGTGGPRQLSRYGDQPTGWMTEGAWLIPDITKSMSSP
jgi:hypothetical protein